MYPVGQKLQRERFHRFFRGVLALCALVAGGFALGILAVDGQRAVADEDIKVLALDDLCCPSSICWLAR